MAELYEPPAESGPYTGVSVWKREAARMAQRVNTSLLSIVDNDFETNTAADSYVFLSGAVTYDTGMSGGVARCRTTTTVLRGGALVYNAGGAALIGNPGGEPWYTQSRSRIGNAPSNQTEFQCIGLATDLTPTKDAVTFGLFGQHDQTYLALWNYLGGGAGTVTVSNIAADFAGFHTYGMGYDPERDAFFCMYDGVPIISLDGPIADLSTNPCFVFAGCNNGGILGTQDTSLYVDSLATLIKPVT